MRKEYSRVKSKFKKDVLAHIGLSIFQIIYASFVFISWDKVEMFEKTLFILICATLVFNIVFFFLMLKNKNKPILTVTNKEIISTVYTKQVIATCDIKKVYVKATGVRLSLCLEYMKDDKLCTINLFNDKAVEEDIEKIKDEILKII